MPAYVKILFALVVCCGRIPADPLRGGRFLMKPTPSFTFSQTLIRICSGILFPSARGFFRTEKPAALQGVLRRPLVRPPFLSVCLGTSARSFHKKVFPVTPQNALAISIVFLPELGFEFASCLIFFCPLHRLLFKCWTAKNREPQRPLI